MSGFTICVGIMKVPTPKRSHVTILAYTFMQVRRLHTFSSVTPITPGMALTSALFLSAGRLRRMSEAPREWPLQYHDARS